MNIKTSIKANKQTIGEGKRLYAIMAIDQQDEDGNQLRLIKANSEDQAIETLIEDLASMFGDEEDADDWASATSMIQEQFKMEDIICIGTATT